MNVSIKECPDCGTVLLGDTETCLSCGRALEPAAPLEPETHLHEKSMPPLVICPGCGVTVPKGVVRCRDCGAFLRQDLQPAPIATAPQSGTPESFVAEVADDSDFEVDPDVHVVDELMFELTEEATARYSSNSLADAEDVGLAPEPEADDDFILAPGLAMASGAEEHPLPEIMESGPVAQEYVLTPEASAPSEEAYAEQPAVKGDDATDGSGEQGAGAAEAASQAAGDGPADSHVAHSEATAGDVLLDTALAEEAEAAKRQAALRKGGGRRRTIVPTPGVTFVVFCPYGHRILVQEKHRGRAGRCPNCKSTYIVPVTPLEAPTKGVAGTAGGTTEPAAAAAGASIDGAPADTGYSRWIPDVHQHVVNLKKLKLKPDSLVAEYDTADVGCGSEHVLVAIVYQGGGAFRAMQESKKKPVTRKALLDHLLAKGSLETLPVPRHFQLGRSQLEQLKVAQPAEPEGESLFADIPVFGTGRIAVRTSAADSDAGKAYLSFTLSQFREFSEMLGTLFDISSFGAKSGIPLTDQFSEAACHYSDAKLQVLERVEFYRADPSFKLIVLGHKCQGCGMVVSEDSRKKEKIGGKSDASVAKAKCPKCKQKFGDGILWGLAAAPAAPAAPAAG